MGAPLFPDSGLANRSFNGLHTKSKFLAANLKSPMSRPGRQLRNGSPDDEPDLDWFNRPRNPNEPAPDWFDQTPTWKAPESPLHDGRTLVLEST